MNAITPVGLDAGARKVTVYEAGSKPAMESHEPLIPDALSLTSSLSDCTSGNTNYPNDSNEHECGTP